MDTIEYNKKLIERYPWLLPRNVWSDEVPEDYDYSYTKFDEIPDNLKNAYISIEDKTYRKHIGINFRRTGGAILTYVTNRGSAAFGGSTITQQLVKNVTGENETKISRKITEWDRAIKTEILFSKDDILEAYFISCGNNFENDVKHIKMLFMLDQISME